GEARSPGERADYVLRPFVSGVALPLFAFTSAGVTVLNVGSNPAVQSFADTLTAPVTLGVLVGLLVGKPIGVIGGAYLTARFTRASLNPDLRWADVAAVGVLAGIGFTVSLLIAELAFDADAKLLNDAKVGILAATLGAAVISALVLRRRRRALDDLVAEEDADLDGDGIPDVYERES
ncbi:MAG: Na+/H+ antiporter NhaA, partial [Actinomycetota bacterium]|nr:Na+/H+ antiporter NhaA [Actinomycetota bacterium]